MSEEFYLFLSLHLFKQFVRIGVSLGIYMHTRFSQSILNAYTVWVLPHTRVCVRVYIYLLSVYFHLRVDSVPIIHKAFICVHVYPCQLSVCLYIPHSAPKQFGQEEWIAKVKVKQMAKIAFFNALLLAETLQNYLWDKKSNLKEKYIEKWGLGKYVDKINACLYASRHSLLVTSQSYLMIGLSNVGSDHF